MCRIASLFLLQKLKGSMSGDARDFNNIETRPLIKSPHPIIFQRVNYQRGVLLVSTGSIEGHFEGKTSREGHQGGLVLTRQCPGSPGTCNPEETGLPGLPVSWSPTLFSGSGPVGLRPVPWTEKTIERSPVFFRRGSHCCRGDLVRRTNFWFFFMACKS